MGEVYQYHITMLVNRQQEDAIKELFTDKNWTCCLNVISEETVKDVKQSGYDHIFTNFNDSNDKSIDKPEYMEIKSELVNADDDMDTDSTEEASTVDLETLNDPPDNDVDEIKPTVSLVDGETSEISKDEESDSDLVEPVESSTADTEIPSTCTSDDANIGHIMSDSTSTPTNKPLMQQIPMTSGIVQISLTRPVVPITVLPASGYMSDLVSQNTQPHMTRPHRYNVRYTSDVTKGIPKCGYLEDWVAEVNSATQQKVKKRLSQGNVKLRKEIKEDIKLTDGKKKEKPKSKRYSQQQGLSFCSDCKQRFPSLEKLWEHRNEVQHTLPETKPGGASKRHYSPEELLKMGFLQCPECDYYFQDRRKLRQHLFACHRDLMPNPVCQICGEEFQSYKDLHKHKREKQHMDSIWRLNSYQCETCGKHISKYENFKRHKEFSCGKSEAELAVLRIHPCEICGKLFTTMKSARQHVSVVHKQEEAVCDICGKVCKTKFALRSHKRRHFETNRKHACEDCGKSFFTVAILKQHQRVHTKEKPFKCPLCEYTCSLGGNIKKHSRNVHKQELTPIDLRELNKS